MLPRTGAAMELLTLTQAAERTGTSVKALRSRADRGTLTVERNHQGVRHVGLDALHAVGLMTDRGAPQGNPATPPRQPDNLGPLLARLEELAAEAGRYRLLTEQAESAEERLTDQLIEARAEVLTLKQQLAQAQTSPKRRRWWQRADPARAELLPSG